MDDRYGTSNFSDDQLLDELMCEYVDGTMDPSIRKVFDELVNTNPTLADHCHCVAEAHQLLRNSGHHVCAPRQFQSRLRARLNAETGKIDVYGLVERQQQSHFGKYLILTVIFVLGGLALPRHNSQSLIPGARIADAQFSVAPRPPSQKMTPAAKIVRPSIALANSNIEPINVGRRTKFTTFVPTAEAELTLLSD